MAGEIRAKMDELRRARFAMVEGISREIDAVKNEVLSTHVDGLEAMQLPRAELESTKQEIWEIRQEFATLSNGGPPGPLPGTGATSPKPSAISGTSATTSATDPVKPVAEPKDEPAPAADAQTVTAAEVAPVPAAVTAAAAEPMASFQGAHEPG